jgi:hypothetical protein
MGAGSDFSGVARLVKKPGEEARTTALLTFRGERCERG